MKLCEWMSVLDDSRGVFELNIPGAHDAAAQYVQLPHLSKCQSLNTIGLLRQGIRALDIRVKPFGGRLMLVHGKAKAYRHPLRRGGWMALDAVLAQCRQFLAENPGECILFQFKNDDCLEQEDSFDALYRAYISPDPSLWYLENRLPSLGEVRGKIILLRRCRTAERAEYTPNNTGVDFSRWEEQEEKIPVPLKLYTGGSHSATFVIQDRYAYRPNERWKECILPLLNACRPFDGEYLIQYLSTAGGWRGPRVNAKIINREFMRYPLDNKKYYGTIYLDFPFNELSEKIISLNMEN